MGYFNLFLTGKPGVLTLATRREIYAFDMKQQDLLQLVLFFVVLLGMAPLLGSWLARVLEGSGSRILKRFESGFFRLIGIRDEPMSLKEYVSSLIVFNALGILFLLALQLLQANLPFNPEKMPSVPFFLALQTAVSFVTNTNWQSYSGEASLSYLTQMAGLGVQNFLSAATGLAVMAAVARAFRPDGNNALGNFWADVTRVTLYFFLPLSILFAIFLVSQGVVQSFLPYLKLKTLAGLDQIIPLGPAASQIAIKMLGTNGGGFFGVNSAHPFENPTALSNFYQTLAILLLPVAQIWTFGKISKRMPHVLTMGVVMLLLLTGGLTLALWSEYQPHPIAGLLSWMEGKEVRFGIAPSVLWTVITTAASNGSVNAMIDSHSPLTGGVAIFNILLGEIIFGGVGVGLTGMILFAILTVFLSGLMVGRTPEYLGRKIEAREMIWALTGILLPGLLVLIFTSLAAALPYGAEALANFGPHGVTELTYAFASAAGNNGSAFGGLGVGSDFYNIALAKVMLLSRAAALLPILFIADSLRRKNFIAPNAGTFGTEGFTFALALLGVILIVGPLTFFPLLVIGPIAEHLLMGSVYF